MIPAGWIRILGAAALLVAALIGMVAMEQRARALGTRVILPMEGVDPRSLLSGHYVRLQIAQVEPTGGPCPGKPGQPWIALKRAGERHRAVGTGESREEALRLGEVAVRGTVHCLRTHTPAGQPPRPHTTRLDVGLTRFYASQADAERIERALRGDREGRPEALAVVSVGRDGKARLAGLIVDGQRYDLAL